MHFLCEFRGSSSKMKFWLFLGFWANFDGCGKFRTNFEKSDPKSFHDFPKGVFLPKIKLIAQRMPKNSKDNPGENLVLGSFYRWN